MIKRIIFLIEARFNLRDYRRFGIEVLQKNGFSVEIWDLSLILHPGTFNSYVASDVFDYEGLALFKDTAEVCNRLAGLTGHDFVINLIPYNLANLKIHKALSSSNANYGIFYTNVPEPVIERRGVDLLVHYLRRLTGFRYIEWWKQLFMKLPSRWLGVRPASIALATGDGGFSYNYPVNKKTEIWHIHTMDYDLYLQERDKPYTEKNTAVFLDEFFPLHPEYSMGLMGGESPISAERYYKLINRLFDVIEKESKLEIVIAAHPRSTYEKLPDYFNGRTCIKGETINLVKEARLVLAHCTTAVNFANLFYKPVIFITCSEIDKSYEYHWIMEMAKWFGKKPVYMDNPNGIDFKKELNVDRHQYEVYRKAFIKMDNTEELPFWQVVANRLKKWTNTKE